MNIHSLFRMTIEAMYACVKDHIGAIAGGAKTSQGNTQRPGVWFAEPLVCIEMAGGLDEPDRAQRHQDCRRDERDHDGDNRKVLIRLAVSNATDDEQGDNGARMRQGV